MLAEGSAQAMGLLGSLSPDWEKGQVPQRSGITKVLERAADYGGGQKEVQTLHLRSCVTWRQVLASLSRVPSGKEYMAPASAPLSWGGGQCRKKPPVPKSMSSLRHQLCVHKHTPLPLVPGRYSLNHFLKEGDGDTTEASSWGQGGLEGLRVRSPKGLSP